MTLITAQGALNDLCAALSQEDWITIDTEFLRDRTYYPRLCLVQVAPPDGQAMAIDPLAENLDLAPLLELMRTDRVLKIFHAARQDLEIFYHLMGEVPRAVFDTQVAAMVCGFGDQAGYLTLVQGILGARLDKGAQFTDWSRRPLSAEQMSYALDDVIYLRDVYRHLSQKLVETGRTDWAQDEMAMLLDPHTYENNPDEAWQRIKIKSDKPRVLAVLKEVAAWREREAQRRDVPRNRVLRDEIVADLAIHPPKSVDELKKMRNMPGEISGSKWAPRLVKVVEEGLAVPKNEAPKPVAKDRLPSDLAPVAEMLKMLLRIIASEQGVAARLIASGEDIDALAKDDRADIPALRGWRYEIFGQHALKMKQGKLALSLEKGRIVRKEI